MNIVRVCNVIGRWSDSNITARQCGEIVRTERRGDVGLQCLGKWNTLSKAEGG